MFLWARGKRSRWKARRAVIGGWPDVVITYGNRWPSLADVDGDPYSPLSDSHIFEAFAEIGTIAIDAGGRFDQNTAHAEIVDGEIVAVANPLDADPLVTARRRGTLAVAVDAPEVIAAILRFVRDYGPLESWESWQGEPRTVDAETVLNFERAISGRRFVQLAVEMAEAVRLAASDEPYPRWLNDVMNEHLCGTHPVSFNAQDLGAARGAYGWTCDSLLAALWWQFYQADSTAGHTWRRCEGCPRWFVQSRADQKYHDAICRNRANVRKSTATGKRKNSGKKKERSNATDK